MIGSDNVENIVVLFLVILGVLFVFLKINLFFMYIIIFKIYCEKVV